MSVAVITVAVIQPRLGPWSFSLGVAAAAQDEPARDLPLEPTRRLRFTTDEGTWMSLDVSPDGQTIVFDLLGDLYTVSIDGGQKNSVTDCTFSVTIFMMICPMCGGSPVNSS